MNKKMFAFVGAFVLLLGTMGNLWALNDDYNRPNPLIDYVAQEIAIFDGRYEQLGEDDCRACHGDSLADRHHYTDIVLRDNLCTPCHEVISGPPGVIVIRDCTTSGCHSWDDVLANGWHHDTDLAGSENCVACHDTNIVAEIDAFSSFATYPPSVVTPTPFSCENCHWEQELVDTYGDTVVWTPGDTVPTPANAGHPSTYEHEDAWGYFVGYWEYKKEIAGNFDTHHMGFKGTVSQQCWKCHSNDPNEPSWDPYDPELIRYCEICHDISTLHTIFPHVGPPGTGDKGAYEGWDAVGFHAGGGGTVPTVYEGDNAPGITNTDDTLHFTQNEMCWGCHGDNVPAYEGEIASAPSPIAMEPMAVCPTGYVEITGTDFGIEDTEERGVMVKEGTAWIEVPVYSWTDTRIVFEVPAWTFTPGNHKIRVYTETGKDDTLPKLTIKDCSSALDIVPESGECKTLIVLSNGSGLFGPSQDTISGANATDGVFRTVEIVSSTDAYVAGKLQFWGNNTVKVKVNNSEWFVDGDSDYLRDTGEAEVLSCEGLAVGTYSVYLKYIFYGDDDGSGTYTNGDTIYQVESGNPVYFELTNDPYITGVNPNEFAKGDRAKVIGLNFGPTANGNGFVFIGSKGQYLGDCVQGIECECYGKHCFRYDKDADDSGYARVVDGDADDTDGDANVWNMTDKDHYPLGTGGKLQNPETKIKLWSSTKIKVKAAYNPTKWGGKKKYVWVVKDGKVSNAYKVKLLP